MNEGNLTVTLKELGSFTYRVEVDAQQSGRQVDIIVILSALGQTLGAVRHVGDISDAGEFIYGSGRADCGLPQCGDVLRSAGTMKFSERNPRWIAISETESCGDLTLAGTLTRPCSETDPLTYGSPPLDNPSGPEDHRTP